LIKNKDMVHTIFVPDSASIQIPIPKEYIGIKLEVIAFPVEDFFEKEYIGEKVIFTDFGIDAPEYKFDREEANAR
jgi:putative transposon-encoded protein